MSFPKLKKEEHQMKNNSESILTSPETWIEDNSHEIMTLWQCISNYNRDMDLTFLDKCNFDLFLDFVVKNSTHYRSYYYESEEESQD